MLCRRRRSRGQKRLGGDNLYEQYTPTSNGVHPLLELGRRASNMNQSQREYIHQHAKPGESYEEACKRLLVPKEDSSFQSFRAPLAPKRHAQGDFFVADIMDASIKDDTSSMEHPLFALRAGDRRVRVYEHNDTTIEVRPGRRGLATIHDKDVWIYCISQLVEAMNRGREEISRTVHFTAYDFMVTTNRRTDGDSYKRMGEALERLSESRVVTNIATAGKRERSGFGLIDSWRVIERNGDNRMVSVEVTLPDWLYRSVKAKQVLTLDRDYFRLRKPLDRRIYELARKHCGIQKKWMISLEKMYKKSGSSASLREFRRSVKLLAESNLLPGYQVAFDTTDDMVTFHPR